MLAKLQAYYTAAKTKVTTYFAAVAASIALLPEMVKDYWDQAVAAVPNLNIYHHYVAAAALLATIVLRVRREVNGTQAPPTPTPPAPPAVKVPAIALLLGLMMLAWAVTPVYAAGPNTATLTWTPATTRTDGTTIPGAVTFNVYRGVGAGGESATPYLTGLTGTTYADSTGIASGTVVCYQMTEVETATGLESARTNEACKTFPQAPPSAPAALTVK